GPNVGAGQGQNADGDAFSQQRNTNYGAVATQPLSYLSPGIVRVRLDIGNVDDPLLEQHSSMDTADLRHNRNLPGVFDPLVGETVELCAKEHSTDLPRYRGFVGFTKARRRLDQCL